MHRFCFFSCISSSLKPPYPCLATSWVLPLRLSAFPPFCLSQFSTFASSNDFAPQTAPASTPLWSRKPNQTPNWTRNLSSGPVACSRWTRMKISPFRLCQVSIPRRASPTPSPSSSQTCPRTCLASKWSS